MSNRDQFFLSLIIPVSLREPVLRRDIQKGTTSGSLEASVSLLIMSMCTSAVLTDSHQFIFNVINQVNVAIDNVVNVELRYQFSKNVPRPGTLDHSLSIISQKYSLNLFLWSCWLKLELLNKQLIDYRGCPTPMMIWRKLFFMILEDTECVYLLQNIKSGSKLSTLKSCA